MTAESSRTRRIIHIPFTVKNEEMVLDGSKSATTRRRTKGQPGDIFKVRDRWYVLRATSRLDLGSVAEYWHREEGFVIPEGFRDIWVRLHPVIGWTPDLRVTLHLFGELPRALWPSG